MSSKPSSHPMASADFASSLDCPVCFETCLPPLLQCRNGHLVCSSCSPKLKHCPMCQGKIGVSRNLLIENQLKTCLFPCKYSSSGCGATMLLPVKKSHESQCEFGSYHCPLINTCISSCKWNGLLAEVVPHLLSRHSVEFMQGTDIFRGGCRLKSDSIYWAIGMKCFGHQFLFDLEKREVAPDSFQFHAVTKLIGSPIEAKQFVCKVVLSGNGRKLSCSGAPVVSAFERLDAAAFIERDCLVFSPSAAQFFAVEGSLKFVIEIRMRS